MTNLVLHLATQIMNRVPSLVSVNEEAIKAIVLPAELMPQATSSFLEGTPVLNNIQETVAFYVVMNSLNYQFWDIQEGQMTRYSNLDKVGALAMQESFLMAWLEATKTLRQSADTPTVAQLQEAVGEYIACKGITSIFGDIPAPFSRMALLMETLLSEELTEVVDDLVEGLESHKSLTLWHADRLADTFPLAYKDSFLKKAQLTLMFIAGEWAVKTGDSPVLDVTAAADYQLPKVLRSMGILEYSPKLAALIESEALIEQNSDAENAIRAATIVACEKISKHFGVSIAQVDFWLWLQRNKSKTDKFHLTRTTNY